MDQIIPQMHMEMQQEVVLPGHEKGQEGFLEAGGCYLGASEFRKGKVSEPRKWL